MIYKVNIEKVFGLIGIRCHNYRSDYNYICLECHQKFAVRWEYRASSFNGWYCRGNFITCPFCGKVHHKHICIQDVDTPLDMVIKLRTFKNKLELVCRYSTAKMKKDYSFEYEYKTFVECFIFDFRNKKSMFTKYCNENRELTGVEINVSNYSYIAENSVFRFLNKSSLVYKNKNLVSIIKLLREEVYSKLRGLDKNHKNSIFVFNDAKGMLLFQLLNIAHRLDGDYANLDKNMDYKKHSCAEYLALTSSYSKSTLENIVQANSMLENGSDKISATIRFYGLGSNKAIRKMINEDVTNGYWIYLANKYTSNHDYVYRIAKSFKKINIDIDFQTDNFFQYISREYGISGLVNIVEKFDSYHVKDCISMYASIGNRTSIFDNEKPRLRDLHDYLTVADRYRISPDTSIALPPPEIVKRMEMQIGTIKFMLPTVGRDLLNASRALKNCVASHMGRIGRDYKIVLVANDRGLLTACIAIDKNTIVEAKLYGNKPVSNDPKVCRQIIKWAQIQKLDIATKDIYALKTA